MAKIGGRFGPSPARFLLQVLAPVRGMVMQGQLKAERKKLAEQTVFNFYLNRFVRRPATAH
jgi:hypothetical protein